MANTSKENMGALWPNRFKSSGDLKPEFVGELNVGGVMYQLAAWQNSNQAPSAPSLIIKLTKPYLVKTAMDPAVPVVPDKDLPF